MLARKTFAIFGLALFLIGTLTGCQSTESRNASARPWNSPRGWETGMPGMINEGR